MDPELEKHEILESIAEKFTVAYRDGLNPRIEDYQSDYPELAAELSDLLSSIVMIEQVKGHARQSGPDTAAWDRLSGLQQIGDYRILKEIGRGGMGVVFAAEHQTLGRKVAIKVMPTPAVCDETTIKRFRREAQSAARLHHTNIVSVFGVGEGDGICYYVMDLVDGWALSEWIGQLRKQLNGDQSESPDLQMLSSNLADPLAPENRFRWTASVGIQLADAISHAHSKDILHRDIKPANILLDRQGTVWITDFGLAKDAKQQIGLTQLGDVVGTPQYLAPEALEGRYDPRSEVYCLGLVLYELATLKPAYSGATSAEIIRAVASRSPTSIRKVDPGIPIDLGTIIDKSLARDPMHRYATAEDLKQDLVAFTENRPISARPPSSFETAVRWARSNPLSASLAGLSGLLLLLVAITASVGYATTRRALSKESQIADSLRLQQTKTESARQLAEKNLSLMEAQYARAESNVSLTIEAFDEMFKAIVARGAHSAVDLEIDGYREISGMETALTRQDAEFLNRMVPFYEDFASLNSSNESLRAESAKAYRRLGNIYQLVGQASPAIEAYQKSLKQLPRPSQYTPADVDLLLTRVRTQNELSTALRRNGAIIGSQRWYQKSVQMLEDFLELSPVREVRLELARTLGALGFSTLRAMNSGGLATVPANTGLSRRAADLRGPIREPPIQSDPPERVLDPRSKENAPKSSRGDFFARNSRNPALDRARRMWVLQNKPYNYRALEILDELMAEDPDNPDIESVRAGCLWNLAAASIDEDRSGAIEYRGMAIESLERLVANHPDKLEYRYLLALSCSLVATPMDDAELRQLQRGTEVIQALIEQYSILDYEHLHANLRVKQASFHTASGNHDRALKELRAARSSITQLLENATSDRSYVVTLGILVRELQQLQRSYREEGNMRSANEIASILAQIRAGRNAENR
jgi:eukaryotic-like serine/threonine-protein kinase